MINEKIIVHAHECKCVSWKPIIIGALVAIGLSFLLNLFMVAIGLTAFTTNSEGVEKLAFSGLIATSLGTIACMFASGWISGYLSQNYCTKRHLGALYGFLTWCLALIVTILLVAQVQQYISFYGHFISGRASTFVMNNNAVNASVAANIPPNSLVVSTYIMFILFFLGAFSSSLGGHCGARYKCLDDKNL